MHTMERLMPSFDRHEVHETLVRAPAERVMQALREVTPEEIRFFLLFTWLRGFGRRRLRSMGFEHGDERLPLLEVARRGGFVELAASEREVLLGVIGRFWRPSGEARGVRGRRGVRVVRGAGVREGADRLPDRGRGGSVPPAHGDEDPRGGRRGQPRLQGLLVRHRRRERIPPPHVAARGQAQGRGRLTVRRA